MNNTYVFESLADDGTEYSYTFDTEADLLVAFEAMRHAKKGAGLASIRAAVYDGYNVNVLASESMA